MGRTKHSSVVLNDKGVSRLHALLVHDKHGVWHLIDKDSRLGEP